jgi:hypothetical protein
MRALVERWYALSLKERISLWLTFTLVLLSLIWITGRDVPSFNSANSQIVEQWRELRQLQAQQTMPLVQAPVLAFTPLEFQFAGTQLVDWQPEGSGGQMVLDTHWQQVAEIFALLGTRNMSVKAFSLKPVAKTLRLTLQLEHINDTR